MESIAHLFALIAWFFLWLIFRTFFSFWQAIAGILYPTRSPIMARYQRLALLFLLPGIVLLTIGIPAALLFNKQSLAFWTTLPGVAAVLLAGMFGYFAEAESKRVGATKESRSA